jgi:hypothetical protein
MHSIFVLLAAAFIPLWILPSTLSKLSAGVFCVQFGVQGALGVVSITFPSLPVTFALSPDPYFPYRNVSGRIPCDLSWRHVSAR